MNKTDNHRKKKVAIIGGGPAGLFMYKKLTAISGAKFHISVFEKKAQLGAGMPYSAEGACDEHITNVSGNEIPEIVTTVKEWIAGAPSDLLRRFSISPETYNDFKVLPRLLFGEYLSAQFALLRKSAKQLGHETEVHTKTVVLDVHDDPINSCVKLSTAGGGRYEYDAVIICTGHRWPQRNEGRIAGWFDSPYPPSKLATICNFPVAIKGASLTAIDAVRTLARQHGSFTTNPDHTLSYSLNPGTPDFRLVLHALDGLLPALRFHLEDTHLGADTSLLSEEELAAILEANDGFIPLDYIFERNFKLPLREKQPEFYARIRDLSLEDFVQQIMEARKQKDPFELLKQEYAEAERSIQSHHTVYWKELLAVLSYAMNYPAKHLPAEDMLRLKKVLMPLISIVIAFVPQNSCREIMALHDAGILSLVPVSKESSVVPDEAGGAWYYYDDKNGNSIQTKYNMYVDAVGQPPFMLKDFIFDGLKNDGTVSAATLVFRDKQPAQDELEAGNEHVQQVSDDRFYLKVPGININDRFQVLDKYGAFNPRVFVMAVPYIAGLNPDYSGLDFCDVASSKIATAFYSEELKEAG